MRTSFSSTALIPCLIVAIWLTGCASRNPLIDEPVAPVAAPAKPVEATTRTAETKPAETPVQQAATAAAAAEQPKPAASGVTATGPTGLRRMLGKLAPYRIDIQQGNFISREMVAQLEEGMKRDEGITPEQVRFVLGTPLLTDVFHGNRWDYVFRLKKNTGEVITSRVTVLFKDNRLVAIEGGNLPTEEEYLALIAGAAPGAKAAATAK